MSKPTTPRREILIVGATGKQGSAVISALLSLPPTSPPIHILALTRDPFSRSVQILQSRFPASSISLILGDARRPDLFLSARPAGCISAAFLMTNPPDEEPQAKPLIDALLVHGTRHIVFSSVDRGGDAKSWSNPTDIKHFYEKHRVEEHLRERVGAHNMQAGGAGTGETKKSTWTILRPTAFMENTDPGTFCRLFTAMWAASLSPTTKLQLVSVRDVGRFAAQALVEPEQWHERTVALAGDELTLDEVRATFRRVVGREVPQAWGIVGRATLWAIPEVARMFAFFEREGYGADIAALKVEEPRLENYETWLREGSKWRDQIK